MCFLGEFQGLYQILKEVILSFTESHVCELSPDRLADEYQRRRLDDGALRPASIVRARSINDWSKTSIRASDSMRERKPSLHSPMSLVRAERTRCLRSGKKPEPFRWRDQEMRGTSPHRDASDVSNLGKRSLVFRATLARMRKAEYLLHELS